VQILKARRVGEIYETTVDGTPFPLDISWVGDGRLPVDQQQAILSRRRVRG
jgi:hypothetical protein